MRAILTYHSLDNSGSVISMPPAQFRRHMQWLAESDVRVCRLEDVVRDARQADIGAAGGDAVALTFDDGFANFADVALPVLRDHGFPATVFVVTSRVGLDNAWSGQHDAEIPVLPLMSWQVLGDMEKNGVTIGAHTRTHPHLTQLTAPQITDEILGSADDIATQLGTRPNTFAYPYGDVDATVRAVAERGFAVACTTQLGTLGARTVPTLTPRLDTYYFQQPGQLEAWGTAAFHARINVRGSLRRVRRLLS
jgi:peptidoglycan/xylan/chitin deacetylase (PgdA/CDA1 family)